MRPCWINPGSKKLSHCLAIVGLATCLLAAASAAAQAPKKVRIAYGGQTLNLSYPWLQLPGPLNYWKQEGYDVEVFIAGKDGPEHVGKDDLNSGGPPR